MNRRSFLKLIGSTTAAVMIGLNVVLPTPIQSKIGYEIQIEELMTALMNATRDCWEKRYRDAYLELC